MVCWRISFPLFIQWHYVFPTYIETGHNESIHSIVVVQLHSHVWLFATPWIVACQGFLSFTISQSLLNSCPLSCWCHPTISSSVAPFSSCPQSFPASGSFSVSRLVTSGGQSIGASVSASVLLMNIQGWFPLELTSLISLLSKGLSRVFSSTTVQKHQFWSTWIFEGHYSSQYRCADR